MKESYLVVETPEEQKLQNSKPEEVRKELSIVKSSYTYTDERIRYRSQAEVEK